MTSSFILAICLVAILLAIIAARRIRLKKRSEQLSAKIRRIPSYESNRINEERKAAVSARNERFSADIATDLETSFENRYITFYGKGVYPLLYGLLQGSGCARSAAQGLRYRTIGGHCEVDSRFQEYR